MSTVQGWKYQGDWIKGKMTGKGLCQWADGTVYEGLWLDCSKEGQGS